MSSSDEGEIRDDGLGHLKASHHDSQGENGIDRQSRQRDSSPNHDSESRGSGFSRHSPSPRGFKRPRDDRNHSTSGRDYDPRSFRDERHNNISHHQGRESDSTNHASHLHDQPSRSAPRRPRHSYEDLDAPSPRYSNHYDEPRQHARLFHDSRRDNDRSRGRDRNGDRDRDHCRNRPRDRLYSRHEKRDRGRYHEEVSRRRSRSPAHFRGGERLAYGSRFVREGSHDSRQGPASSLPHDEHPQSRDKRHSPAPPHQKEEDGHQPAYRRLSPEAQATDSASRRPSPEPDYEIPTSIDEDAEIERRRKRREQLLANCNSITAASPHHPAGVAGENAGESSRDTPPIPSRMETAQRPSLEPDPPRSPASGCVSPTSPASRDHPSPGGADLLDDKGLMNTHGDGRADDQDGPSAADYDPTVDMEEDERRDERRHGQGGVAGDVLVPSKAQDGTERAQEQNPGQGAGASDDDDFDMFAEDFDEERYAAQQVTRANQPKGGLLEGDDVEGFYKVRIGEVLDERYQIKAVLGQGMFARVALATDMVTKKDVAVKIMRNNYALRKGGYTEIAILRKLNDADASNKKHIVRFERSFEYHGHLCMAFESLHMNLREVLRKFGKNVGINLDATRKFARQIFIALGHMRDSSIIHADIKPDNILIHESRQFVKICDLGTAIDRSDAATAHAELTPYLVSRFYRAPEVILGMPYDYGIDMWSTGCTLFELFTGKILFPGESNNQMLKVVMEIRGRMYPKYYKRGQLWRLHFDDDNNFLSTERDRTSNKEMQRTLAVKPTRSLGSRLEDAGLRMAAKEKQELELFKDLLENCLALHPDRRITPAEALQHPFFTSHAPRKKKAPAEST